MQIDIKNLFQEQDKFDTLVLKNHHLTAKEIFEPRLLAFIVELGEFINSTKSFKFWSFKVPFKKYWFNNDKIKLTNKQKEITLEEFIDGLHFLLSLGLYLKTKKTIYVIEEKKNINLFMMLFLVYQDAIKLKNHRSLILYEKLFQNYFNLLAYFDFTVEEILATFQKKLAINFQRQKDFY